MRFYFSLAKELGMTVEYMLNNISSDELNHWMGYAALEKEDEDWARLKAGGN